MPPRGPLSVAMISASFYPAIGGAEKQAVELSAALRRRGHSIKILTRRSPGSASREEINGVAVRRLWCLGGGRLNAATFMLSLAAHLLAKSGSYDVIHVHLAGSPALVAALWGRVRGRPVFVKLGGGRGIGELAASRPSWAGRLKLFFLGLLSPVFIAVTSELVEEARQYLGDVRVRVIPNGVNVEKYSPAAPERKRELRARFGWPEGLGFLYVGRFSPEKRLGDFLESWGDFLEKTRREAFFVLMGSGSEEMSLRELVGGRSWGNKVLFMPPSGDVGPVYDAADIFVLPSISEGLSNALLEAMASGLAVLGSRVGGTAEAIEDGASGLLFEPRDGGSLRSRLEQLLGDEGLPGRLGARARRAAEDRYSLEQVAARYESLYYGS